MKLFVCALALLGSVLAKGEAAVITTNNGHYYQEIAFKSIGFVWDGLKACGLLRLNAYDPRLPRPHIPATEAVVTTRGNILAYSLDRTVGWIPQVYELKNPNGGENHFVAYTANSVGFQTPYGGIVASVNTVATTGAVYPQFMCRGRVTTYEVFEQCLKELWINTITAQLCRFAD